MISNNNSHNCIDLTFSIWFLKAVHWPVQLKKWPRQSLSLTVILTPLTIRAFSAIPYLSQCISCIVLYCLQQISEPPLWKMLNNAGLVVRGIPYSNGCLHIYLSVVSLQKYSFTLCILTLRNFWLTIALERRYFFEDRLVAILHQMLWLPISAGPGPELMCVVLLVVAQLLALPVTPQ